MPGISPGEVARLAALARISLTPAELDKLAGQLDAIIEAVAQVAQAVGPDTPATSHPIELANVFRDDIVRPSLTLAEALSSAPAAESDQFKVPQIIGEEP